jgi:hypothetical protein
MELYNEVNLEPFVVNSFALTFYFKFQKLLNLAWCHGFFCSEFIFMLPLLVFFYQFCFWLIIILPMAITDKLGTYTLFFDITIVSNWEACEGSFYPIYFIMIVTIYFEIYVEAMKLVSSNIFIMTLLWCLIFLSFPLIFSPMNIWQFLTL